MSEIQIILQQLPPLSIYIYPPPFKAWFFSTSRFKSCSLHASERAFLEILKSFVNLLLLKPQASSTTFDPTSLSVMGRCCMWEWTLGIEHSLFFCFFLLQDTKNNNDDLKVVIVVFTVQGK